MEKQYRYDHKQTPQATRPQTVADNPQDVNQTPPDDTYTPPATTFDDSLPKTKSMWPTYVGLTSIILILGFLIYRQRPQTFEACSRLPGSTVTSTDCTTFYGATFVKNSTGGIVDSESPTPTDEDNYDITIDTTIPELDEFVAKTTPTPTPNDTNHQVPTTKGGLPLPTPTPIKPTPSPSKSPSLSQAPGTQNTNGWVRHRYPDQRFTMMLPPSANSNVIRHRDTNITIASVWTNTDSSHPYMTVALKPNWDNTGNAKNQPINFKVDTQDAIKVEANGEIKVYAEFSGQVWVFTCKHNDRVDSKRTCDNILKSIDLY